MSVKSVRSYTFLLKMTANVILTRTVDLSVVAVVSNNLTKNFTEEVITNHHNMEHILLNVRAVGTFYV